MNPSPPRRAFSDVLPRPEGTQVSVAGATDGLSANDHGRLPEATRRVLVQLLKGPYVIRDRHSQLWPSVIANEAVIRERLGDLFLELVLDRDAGLAFVRNLSSPEADLPRVIRSTPLTLIDTALVLYLREQLLRAEASATRVFVGRDELDDHLAVYRSAADTDAATFARRINASVEKMKNASVLLGTTEDGRFEISPVLGMVFDADEVMAVTRELRALVARAAGAATTEEAV